MSEAPEIILSETRGILPGLITLCDHVAHVPVFTPTGPLTPEQVRARYPRYDGRCAACGQPCRVYASVEHFLAGGWDA